jgi:hypothetical protein
MEVLIFVLFLANLALLAGAFRKQRGLGGWALPTTAWVVVGFLNYPARAVLLVSFPEWNEYGLDVQEMALALTFYTVFTGVLLATFWAVLGKFEIGEASDEEWSATGSLTFLFLLTAAGFAFRFYTGRGVFGLYDTLADLRNPLQDNLWSVPTGLKWLVLPWAWLGWEVTRRRLFLVLALASLGLVLALALITTGKADLLNLVLLYLAGMAYLRRRPSKAAVAVGLAVGVLFGIYSYLARTHGDVRGEFSIDRIVATMSAVESNAGVGTDAAARQLVSRFSYLDGLGLCMRGSRVPPGPFGAGSIVELAGLVPREIWPSRPFLSFNHFLTEAVWGMPGFSETPIGRTGEAYFVLGGFGLAFAGFYGWLWAKVVKSLLGRPGRWRHMLYFLIFFNLLLPDAYLVYGIKPLAYLLPLLWLGFIVDGTDRRWMRERALRLGRV